MNAENNNYKKGWKIAYIVFSLIYIGIVFLYNYGTINKHLLITCVIAIPLIIGWLIYYLLKKDKIKRSISYFSLAFCTISYFIFIVFSFCILVWSEGTASLDNALRYNDLRNRVGYDEYITHFPQKISAEVLKNETTKFYYCPQFLQGGFCFDLLIDADEQMINEEIIKGERNASKIVNSKNEDFEEVKAFGYSHFIFETEKEFSMFAIDATFYVIDRKPYEEDNWNHGVYSYVAVNRVLGKILYFTEVW